MEIKQLEYFAAAVEYGSLNRAAEKLYTTQPNVSRVFKQPGKKNCMLHCWSEATKGSE